MLPVEAQPQSAPANSDSQRTLEVPD
jgi:hypothetical protein